MISRGYRIAATVLNLVCATTFATVSASSAAADTSFSARTLQSFRVDNGADLVIRVPNGWVVAVRKRPDFSVGTLVFTPRNGSPFEFSIDLTGTAKDLESHVRSMADEMAGETVEGTLPRMRLQGANVTGLFFSATDPHPGPGDYRFATRGAAIVRGRCLDFAILTHEPSDRDIVAAALDVIRSARIDTGKRGVARVIYSEGPLTRRH